MNLTIDVGNTRIKYAFFEGALPLFQAVVPAGSWGEINAHIADRLPEAIMISTVEMSEADIVEHMQTEALLFFFNRFLSLPLQLDYETPDTLGMDRLANAVAACVLYANTTTLIIDAGTCVKYDLVDAAGVYRGGAISPGLHMRMEAMHNFTARLPLWKPEVYTPAQLPGKSTKASMLGGGFTGLLFEMEGFIEHFRLQYPDLHVVLTGGDAGFFEKALKSHIFAHPFLTLQGLNEALRYQLT